MNTKTDKSENIAARFCISDAINCGVRLQVSDQVHTQVHSRVTNQVRNQVLVRVLDLVEPIGSQVYGQIRRQLIDIIAEYPQNVDVQAIGEDETNWSQLWTQK